MEYPSFLKSATGAFVIEIFGYHFKGLSIQEGPDDHYASILDLDPTTLQLIQVVAVKGQTLCAKLPKPITLLVATEGTVLTEAECGLAPDGELKKWTLSKDDASASLTIESGSFADLVVPVLPIEPRDKSAGIQLSNPRIVNGQACVTIHVWAHFTQCVHIPWDGDKCVTIVNVDDTRDVCVSLSGCVPLYSVGPVSLNACFTAPNQLCVTVDIGVAGWSGQIASQCTTVPIPHVSATAKPCGCTD